MNTEGHFCTNCGCGMQHGCVCEMCDLVEEPYIEEILGIPRDPEYHLGLAVHETERLYIMHSEDCVGLFPDLKKCPMSKALARGIDPARWEGFYDKPVRLWVSAQTLQLVPERLVGA